MDTKKGQLMRNLNGVLFCVGVLATGCALDPADPPPGPQAAATQALADSECSDGVDCATTAAIDDSFSVPTGDGCGRADFVDFGPGAPGGGDNDDYIVIHDFCSDGHGVKTWAWLNGVSVNGDVGRYNGNGLAGDPVIWDPFKALGNVDKGDTVRIKVCLADSSTASSGSSCREATRTSQDG